MESCPQNAGNFQKNIRRFAAGMTNDEWEKKDKEWETGGTTHRSSGQTRPLPSWQSHFLCAA